jgi:octaprenyl-diphosphate synthase
MDLNTVKHISKPFMTETNLLIVERLKSDVALVNQLSYYIIEAGGKRMRPMLVGLTLGAIGYQGEHGPGLAATVEFIHTATLLHDDVVDESELRRGRETANAVFGNQASVLVGDYLYSRAFQLMVEIGQMDIMKIMSDATNTIAEGEVLQLMNCNDADIELEQYYKVIECKTAKLFQAATESAALLAHQPQEIIDAVSDYGRHLGIAFQLIDDALDYTQQAEVMGKNIGDDLAEGKPTLPLLRILQVGTMEQKALVKEAIEKADISYLPKVLEAIKANHAIEYTIECAKAHIEQAKQALSLLPDNEYTSSLHQIADYTIARNI